MNIGELRLYLDDEQDVREGTEGMRKPWTVKEGHQEMFHASVNESTHFRYLYPVIILRERYKQRAHFPTHILHSGHGAWFLNAEVYDYCNIS